MLKITGLDKLQKQLEDATRALEALDGELGSVKFDPNDPSSIETAVQHACKIVDDRTSNYSANPIIGQLAEQMKEKYREGIIKKAAETRLQENK